MKGLLYINHGRTVVDCPFNCGNAYVVKPKQTEIYCGSSDGCHVSFGLDVPDNIGELVAELNQRPDKKNRNWFPEEHPVAVRGRLPQGQSVADLRAELEMHTKGKN